MKKAAQISVVLWRLSAVTAVLLLGAMPAGANAQRPLLPYSHCFQASSVRHTIPVALLQAVVATESDWNPRARSHANAHGLMQIQWPGTAKHLGVGRVSQLYKPCTNINLGAQYLRELLDRYDDDERRALAAYNYGPGRIGTSGPIPRGADKYVATVRQHRESLLSMASETGQPNKSDAVNTANSLTASVTERVATFSSGSRARRYAKLLRRRVPRGTFSVSKAHSGSYELWLTDGFENLNSDDRILLTSLGWRL